MKWVIKKLSEESQLDDLDSTINAELINAELRTYKGNPIRFADKKYHPYKDLVALPISIYRIPEWSEYILKHINEIELEELSEDWDLLMQ